MKISFPFQCNKVLPLTFDDSLSYYEVLCKMRDTINAIIAAGETGLTPWGEIQGDIQDQEDLQAEFDTKQNKLTVNPSGATATLTSLEIDGTKYNISGQSTGATWGSITGTLSNQSDLQAALTALNTLIAEKSEVDANPAATATAHLVKLTIDGTTYDIQSELPIASATTLGGIKASNKTASETVEVKIGTDGKLYVPAAATGQSVVDVTVNGTSVVDSTDNVAKIPAASSSTYGAIKVGDGLRVDSVSGATEVAIADTEDIDEERDNAIIDAGNVRYATVEAMKDNTMASADKAAIKTNLGINSVSGVATGDNWSSITIGETTKNIPSGGGSEPAAYVKSVTETGGALGNGQVVVVNKDNTSNTFDSVRALFKNDLATSYSLTSTEKERARLNIDSSKVSGTNDGTNWQTITIDGTTKNIPSSSGGTVAWGNITGSLIRQTDLANVLSTKTHVEGEQDEYAYWNQITIGDELGYIATIKTSTSTASGADTIRSITVDGTPHNLPSGGSGTTYTASNGVQLVGTDIRAKVNSSNNGIVATADGLGANFNIVQHKLTAGTNIVIDETTNTISASGTGDTVWGTITGTLSDQEDVNDAITGASQTATWGQVDGTLSDQTDLKSALDEKSTVTVSASSASGADTINSITIDGVPHNLPSGGSGTTYTASNGVQIVGTDIRAKVNSSNNGIVATTDGLGANFNVVQTKLTAGDNITIDDNNISATDNKAVWGNITGTLSSQSDLQTALGEKSSVSASTSSASGADTINSITIDGVPHNLPSGGGGITYTADYGVQIDGTVIKAKVNSSNNGIVATQEGLGANFSVVQPKLTAGDNIAIDGNNNISATDNKAVWGNITGTLSSQSDLQTALGEKSSVSASTSSASGADTINSITIDGVPHNLPSGGGGTTYTASNGVQIVGTDIRAKVNSSNNGIVATTDGLGANFNVVQTKLTAGTNITIDANNTISATGIRNITVSTSDPTGGSDGDIWLKYAE